MVHFSVLGAGKIGQSFCEALSLINNATIQTIYDPATEKVEKLAARFGAKAMDSELKAIDDPGVDAVVVTGPVSTRCRLIETCLKLGKAVFCEKPLGVKRKEAERCAKFVEDRGGICSLGFDRRYEPSLNELKTRLDEGEIGKVLSVHMISRNPATAARGDSGGIFCDMTLQDLDLALWLLPEEPSEIYAVADCPPNGFNADDAADCNAVTVVLRAPGGITSTISNSRNSVYGYDRRVEVLGENGLLRAENQICAPLSRYGRGGVVSGKPECFFSERLREARLLEMENFIACVRGEAEPLAGPRDGLKALTLMECAVKSVESGSSVPVK